jgi:hypothetical protein
MGDTSLFTETSFRDFNCRSLGDRADSEYTSGGVSISGEKALEDAAPGGNEGNAFSTVVEPFAPGCACRGALFAFFLRRAMRLS